MKQPDSPQMQTAETLRRGCILFLQQLTEMAEVSLSCTDWRTGVAAGARSCSEPELAPSGALAVLGGYWYLG